MFGARAGGATARSALPRVWSSDPWRRCFAANVQRQKDAATTKELFMPIDRDVTRFRRGRANATLLKVLLRNGSKRRQAAASVSPEERARKRLLLPSFIQPKQGSEQTLDSVVQDIAEFKRANQLHGLAEVPLYCVTIRELGKRGHTELAQTLARKVIDEKATLGQSHSGSDVEDNGKSVDVRIYSALLEGFCMRRAMNDAISLYTEVVEKHNILPSTRALHMMMEMLTADHSSRKQSRQFIETETSESTSSEAKSKSKRATKEDKPPSLAVADIYEEMKSRGKLTIAAYNMLLPIVGNKERKISSLKNILNEITASKLPCNQLTWKALLTSARGPEEFGQITQMMSKKGWKPSLSIDPMLCVMPKFEPLQKIMDVMDSNIHLVHASTFDHLICAFSRAGNFDGAFATAVKMRKANFLLSKRAFLSFLKCAGYTLQESDLEWMWRDLTRKIQLSGRSINRDYYHAKMIANLRRKDPEGVRRAFEEMEERGITPNNYTYHLLILVEDLDGFF